jgi:manganese transport protein
MYATVAGQDSLIERTLHAGREVLLGRQRGRLALLPFAGPAAIVSIAYMDPGNLATNIQAGAGYGCELLWVALAACLVAALLQGLAAKVGIATGRNLAELCREHFAPPVVYAMWLASEVAAIATELAELLGAGLGLTLLCGIPLLPSVILVAIATCAALRLQRLGFRSLEILIGCFIGVIVTSYLIELVIAPPDWGAVAAGVLVPRLHGTNSIIVAVGIVGATVMPHAIYLHSGLTQARFPVGNAGQRRNTLVMSHNGVLLALGIAGLVNMAMIILAARAFHDGVHDSVVGIEAACRTLVPLLGLAAAGMFMLALLASGFSSSIVAVMAGQTIMQGFVSFRVPLWFRRLVVITPSFIVVAAGIDITQALVLSQVVLSLVLPIPMVALVKFTARRDVMGEFVNSRLTNVLAVTAAGFVCLLNGVLLLAMAAQTIPTNLMPTIFSIADGAPAAWQRNNPGSASVWINDLGPVGRGMKRRGNDEVPPPPPSL